MMLKSKPEERKDAADLLNHPWFEKMHSINKAVGMHPDSAKLM